MSATGAKPPPTPSPPSGFGFSTFGPGFVIRVFPTLTATDESPEVVAFSETPKLGGGSSARGGSALVGGGGASVGSRFAIFGRGGSGGGLSSGGGGGLISGGGSFSSTSISIGLSAIYRCGSTDTTASASRA